MTHNKTCTGRRITKHGQSPSSVLLVRRRTVRARLCERRERLDVAARRRRRRRCC